MKATQLFGQKTRTKEGALPVRSGLHMKATQLFGRRTQTKEGALPIRSVSQMKAKIQSFVQRIPMNAMSLSKKKTVEELRAESAQKRKEQQEAAKALVEHRQKRADLNQANRPEVMATCFKKHKATLKADYMVVHKSPPPISDVNKWAAGICKLEKSKQSSAYHAIRKKWNVQLKAVNEFKAKNAKARDQAHACPKLAETAAQEAYVEHLGRKPNDSEKRGFVDKHCYKKTSLTTLKRQVSLLHAARAFKQSRSRSNKKMKANMDCSGKAKRDITSAYRRFHRKNPSSSILAKYSKEICINKKPISSIVSEIKKSTKTSVKKNRRRRGRRR